MLVKSKSNRLANKGLHWNQRTEEDAYAIKDALLRLFENDASSARPEGSIEVHRLYWWQHKNAIGQHSSAKVHQSLQIQLLDDVIDLTAVSDYSIEVFLLPDLEPEVLERF